MLDGWSKTSNRCQLSFTIGGQEIRNEFNTMKMISLVCLSGRESWVDAVSRLSMIK